MTDPREPMPPADPFQPEPLTPEPLTPDPLAPEPLEPGPLPADPDQPEPIQPEPLPFEPAEPELREEGAQVEAAAEPEPPTEPESPAEPELPMAEEPEPAAEAPEPQPAEPPSAEGTLLPPQPAELVPPLAPLPVAAPLDEAAAPPAEPVETEAAEGPAEPVAAERASAGLVVPVLAFLALALLVLNGVLTYAVVRTSGPAPIEASRAAALQAGREAARLVFSYDYRHLAQDFKAADAVTTGEFKKEYANTTNKLVNPVAPRYKAVLLADVSEAGVVSASKDRVLLLVFLDVQSTSTLAASPKVTPRRLKMTMQRQGGRWLVADIDAF